VVPDDREGPGRPCGVGLRGFESHPPHFLMNPVTYSQAIGEIISFGLWMRKEGYRESTIQPCIRALKAIAKRTDLMDTESAKAYLGSAQVRIARTNLLMIWQGSTATNIFHSTRPDTDAWSNCPSSHRRARSTSSFQAWARRWPRSSSFSRRRESERVKHEI